MKISKNILLSGNDNLIKESLFENVIQTCYEIMGLSQNNVISIAFCSSDEMRKINLKYRGIDNTTDIISFPADDGFGLYKTDEFGSIYLGEIIIDVEYIREQSGLNEIEEEIAKVIVHGFLHLLGFDHLNQKEKHKMQETERKIINTIMQVK